MIDLHSHVLPGLDDGPGTLEGSLEIARAAAEDGIRTLAATPHVRDDYPTAPEEMERRVGELRTALVEAGVAVDVLPGGELDLEWLRKLPRDELERFGLGGNPRYLLVETPYYGLPLDLADRLFELRAMRITPVLAHPERNGEVQASPEVLRPLVETGTLVQLTAASIDGRLGRRPAETAGRLLELGLAHLVASDAHAAAVRGVGLSAAAEAVGDDQLARWLTESVPGAIVAGESLPERPSKRRRKRWLF